MRLLILCLILFALLASPAAASTRLEGPGARSWMDSCIAKSQVPTPDVSIRVIDSKQPGRSWVAPWLDGAMALDGLSQSRLNCHVLLHEIGHLYDWTILTPSDRQTLGCRILNFRSSLSWWSHLSGSSWVEGSEGEEGPLEWFAEAYKLAAISPARIPRGSLWLEKLLDRANTDVGYGIFDHQLSRSGFIRFRRQLRHLAMVRVADRSERDQRSAFTC